MKMKTFTKQNLGQVREDLNKALEQVAKKHGIVLNVGNISYRDESFTAKLIALIPSENSNKEAGASRGSEVKWEVAFKKNAFLFGLKPEDLGKKVKHGSKEYTIVGMRPRARLPLVLKRPDGTFAAFDVEEVKAYMVN
jgi:hypothetical protein